MRAFLINAQISSIAVVASGKRGAHAGKQWNEDEQTYDFTSRYRKQLFDLDKKDYLSFKTAEHKNQITLQRRMAAVRQQVPGHYNLATMYAAPKKADLEPISIEQQ